MHHTHIQTYFFLILLSAVLALTFFIFLPYFNALIIAGVLAIVFRPIFRKISTLLKGRGGLAALITILLVIFAVIIPLFFIGQQIISEARVVFFAQFDASGGSPWWQMLISYIPGGQVLQERIVDMLRTGWEGYLQRALSWLVGNVGSVFSSVAQIFVGLFIGLIAFYYFLKDGSNLKQRVVDLSPLSNNYDREIFTRLQGAVSSVIRGQLVIAVIQGALTGIGLLIFGIPNPALWGTVAMFAALVPAFGTSLVLIPAIIYAFATGALWQGIGLIIWGVLVVGLIDNFLRPRLIGRKIHVHSLLTLLSILGGIGMFGPIGFLVGPLVLSLLFALLDIYKSVILHEGQIAPIEHENNG